MATILTKRSNTASSVPLAADLTNSTSGAELAVNTADKRLFTKDSGGSVVELGTNPSSLTLTGGTANGVPYLNGSKVLTTGSALTFDGTTFRTLSGAVASGGSVNGKFRLDRSDGATNLGYIDWVTSGDGLRFYNNNGGYFSWEQSASGELMRLTSTGLGIGTSSPQYPLDVVQKTNDDSYVLQLRGYTTGADGTRTVNMRTVSSNAGDWANFRMDATSFIWRHQGGTERARIDSSGNLLVGTTSAVTGGSNTTASATLAKAYNWFAVTDANYIQRSNNTDGSAFQFLRGSSTVGSITLTSTSTSYNTSSDYRLKENIQPMTGALAKVAMLKPCTYKWNADGSDGEGFIAHELAEVYPDAVTGEKDAVDAEGKPVYQGIDTSFLAGLYAAALQELKAELDAVKSELNNLKGN